MATVDHLADSRNVKMVHAVPDLPGRRAQTWQISDAVQGNVASVRGVEPCKPPPLSYTQCVPGHGASAMKPERRKCGREGEAMDESS